jgi:acyl dehydratase
MDIKELNGYSFEALRIGMSAVYSRTITDTDLRNFSGVSGDTNPMHLNEEYARTTKISNCIRSAWYQMWWYLTVKRWCSFQNCDYRPGEDL